MFEFPKHCPICGATWEQEETITEFFQEYPELLPEGKSPEEAASLYGDTPETPRHFGKNVVFYEDPKLYDGVSWVKCTNCETVFDRWTMEPTKELEV